MADAESSVTVLSDADTAGLGTIRLRHPPGTFALTPASRITVAAVGAERDRLEGAGIDWGSGVGCVAIAAARIPAVRRVLGLEIVEANVQVARENARANGVDARTEFHASDSYSPLRPGARRALAELEGGASFVVANPPAARDGDGFGWRREVARGAVRFLTPGGVFLVQVSSQYGMHRVRSLEGEGPGLRYDGVAATTDLQPFDLNDPALRAPAELYAATERHGGPAYDFRWPGDPATSVPARDALRRFLEAGTSPLSRWQVHRFLYRPAQDPGATASR
ncbi:MAG: methyltransferase [Gemmatimonadota bacterium]|jgi:SAM-dependent methyltransferase